MLNNKNSYEFGHANNAGYVSTIGCNNNNGYPFLAFSAEAGTNNNTFKTRGLKGNVILADTSGNLTFNQVTTASADNQALVERMRILHDGNVGIGTSAPSSKLHLADGSDVYLTLESTHASVHEEVAIKFNNFSTGSNFWWLGQNQSAEFSLAYGTSFSNANTKFFINTSGKVGIGTTAPGYPLDVEHATSPVLAIRSTGANVNPRLIIDAGGGSGTADPHIKFDSDGVDWSIGTDQDDSDKFKFAASSGLGSPVMTIQRDGKVGIGTTAPGYLLHLSAAQADISVISTTGTNRAGFQSGNTGGYSYFYKESSGGGGAFAGTSAYSTIVGGTGAYPLHLGTNSLVRMTIASDGKVGIGGSAGSIYNTAGLEVGNGTDAAQISLYSGTGTRSEITFADGTTTTTRFSGFSLF